MRTFLFFGLMLAGMTAPSAGQTLASTPAPAQAASVDREKARAVVTELARQLEENFVFPDKANAYAAMLRANLSAGRYDGLTDAKAFAEQVTKDLQAVHPDGHLRVHLVPQSARSGPAAERRGPPADVNAITKSGWLAPGVAYIDFAMFPGNAPTTDALRSFLAAHQGAKSLIIDARGHRGGGLAEMNLLFPALYPAPATLLTMETRDAVDRREGDPPAEDMLRRIDGPAGVVRREHHVVPAATQSGLARAKVYLLTSKRTASAGEHLALALKRTGRATIVGETTRGAGHYGNMVPLDPEFTFAAFIPVGRTFDPDTGEGWEGVGVAPDVAVPADQALDEALKRAGVALSGNQALEALQ